MLRSIKRLWNDRRGNALAITAAALPLVVGSAGLATDTIQWVTWKRQLQRAADSGAFAGAYAKTQSAAVDPAVAADLKNNNHTPASLLAGYPQIEYPVQAGWTDAVRVTLKAQKRLGFSSLFLSQPPIITTTATAAMVPDGKYCVVALKKKAEPGITIQGSSKAKLGCGAIANSTHATDSVKVNGDAHSFEATEVASAGGMSSEINGTDKLSPYHTPLKDPFKDKYPTNIPETVKPCKKLPNNTTTYSPGCYTEFKFSGNGTYTLSPGVYYLDSASFDVSGNPTIIGDGVTIILTGDTPGSIKMNGESTIQLTAPTKDNCAASGACAYEKMLFIQAANATAENSNTINGSNTSFFDGAMYFPSGLVSFTGSSEAMTKCVMVVASTVDFSGNSNLQNDIDDDDCDANQQVTGWTIRLVA